MSTGRTVGGEEDLCSLPRTLLKKVKMTSGGEALEPLWLVGSPIDPLAHFDGDHGVLLTMQHENGRLHETDIPAAASRGVLTLAFSGWLPLAA